MDDIAGRLASFVVESGRLPNDVMHEARRAFLNITGCMIGAAQLVTVDIAAKALTPLSESRNAALVCRGQRTDILTAALVNCLASTVRAFNDTYEGTLAHPSGPAAAAGLALAEFVHVSGTHLLTAFALGVESACRLAKVATANDGRNNIGWCATSITGGIGAAVTAGHILGLGEAAMHHAIGIALSQASGFRATQGSMNHDMIHAWPATAGLKAALLAKQGFTSALQPIEGHFGFLSVFSKDPDTGALTDGLGEDYEMLRNTYKPYPCGVVINPVIDACLELRRVHDISSREILRVTVTVSPQSVAICDRPLPQTSSQAVVSLQYWAAVALHRGHASLPDLDESAVADDVIRQLQARILLKSDPQLAPSAAVVALETSRGSTKDIRVNECIGSRAKPLTDDQLDLKFLGQATPVVGEVRARVLADMIWRLDELAYSAELARALA